MVGVPPSRLVQGHHVVCTVVHRCKPHTSRCFHNHAKHQRHLQYTPHAAAQVQSNSEDEGEDSLFWRESWAQDTTVSQVMNTQVCSAFKLPICRQDTPVHMTTQVALLTTSMLVRDAIRVFLQHGVSGAPVVDEHGKLVGVLSEKDIIVEASGGWVLQRGM